MNKNVDKNIQSEIDNKRNLNVEKIIDFANNVDISDVKSVLDRQIEYNHIP